MPEVTDGAGADRGARGRGRRARARGGRRHVASRSTWCSRSCTGRLGEDGAVQGMMELAGVPYVGAGVLGQRRGHGQGRAEGAVRPRRAAAWCPSRWCASRSGARTRRASAARAQALGYPLFSKPATLGSSVGVVKVHGPQELGRRAGGGVPLRRARRCWNGRCRSPREVECAVLGNDDPVASVVGEIVPTGHEFYDYAAKYLDEDGAELRIPADLEPDGRRADPAAGGRGVPRDRLRRHGARGLLRGGRCEAAGGDLAERDQHDPRVHVDLDVPEALGGERAGLPGPDRAAPGPGGGAARRRARHDPPRPAELSS